MLQATLIILGEVSVAFPLYSWAADVGGVLGSPHVICYVTHKAERGVAAP